MDEAGCVLVASDTFGMKNQGQTIEEGIRENREMLKLARERDVLKVVADQYDIRAPHNRALLEKIKDGVH